MLAWSVFDALVHNWALVAIMLTIAVVVGVPWWVLNKYVDISINIMRSTKPPLSRNPLDFDPVDGEPVTFPAYDGRLLHGMLVRGEHCENPKSMAEREPRGMILFAHEFCSDMGSCGRYCRPLLEAGYDVFAFDFRNHGASERETEYTPRQWVTEREHDDIRGAVAFILAWLEQNNRPQHIGLFGVSRGACAGVLVAEERPEVRALLLDGAFSTDACIEYFMKRWAVIFGRGRVLYENFPPRVWAFMRWAMIRKAQRTLKCTFPSVRKALTRMTPRPLMFIHGEKDSYLPIGQTRLLYALAPQPKWFWIAPGARHNQAAVLHPEVYARYITGFFDAFLGATPAEPAETPTAARAIFSGGRTPAQVG